MVSSVTSYLSPLAIGIPLLSAVMVFFVGRRKEHLRNQLVIIAGLVDFLLIFSMLPASLEGIVFKAYLFKMTPFVWIFTQADQLGLLFALTVSSLWFLAAVYSLEYMKDEHAQTRYYFFLLLCLSWTIGVAFSGNLLTFFIFYELFSFSTYPLIIHEQTPEALAAGKKYMVYILVGGVFIFFSIIFTFFLTGSQVLTETGILSLSLGHGVLRLLFWSFVIGFGVKAAIMPLHGWVPDAHPAAPASFSALLSGVMVAAGAFAILRVIYNVFGVHLVRQLGVGPILSVIVSVTIILASVMALDQDNLKRRLAYSTIGQMGYVILGASLLTPEAAWGGIIHITNQAFMKGTMFFCAGVIIKKTGKKNISEMQGIGSKLPITMGAFTLAALGMVGVPPLSGFISKWYLGIGTLEADKPIYLIVLLLSSLLNAAYFLPIIYSAFFGKAEQEEGYTVQEVAAEAIPGPAEVAVKKYKPEASWLMLVPIIIGASIVFFHGLFSIWKGLPFSLTLKAVEILFR